MKHKSKKAKNKVHVMINDDDTKDRTTVCSLKKSYKIKHFYKVRDNNVSKICAI